MLITMSDKEIQRLAVLQDVRDHRITQVRAAEILNLSTLWCEQNKIEHVFTQPGNPQQNAYVERFNRTVRYECLNQYLFRELSEVQDYTTTWQHFYNHERPHMAVNGWPPHFKQQ